MSTADALDGARGMLILLSGDVPLLSTNTLKTLVERHSSTGAAATVVTAIVENPHGYGRIVRAESPGQPIARIVEQKDATAAEQAIREINSGIYAFELEGLFEALRRIASENAQREYYLPDLVAIYRQAGRTVETVTVSNPDEIRGINSRRELAAVSSIVRHEKATQLMDAGVTIDDPDTAYVDDDVTIGPDTILHPCVFLEGRTTIGSGCEIHSGARIIDSQIGDRVTVLNHSVITGSRVEAGASVGPFAHLRAGSDVREGARVGNFVELKKTVLGAGSKAGHLSYLGDATIGANVNIGAGTITCNYDGAQKHQTVIGDGAFIGSDTQLIAPVTVGNGAYVGSGTTIREDVPEGSLAVSAGKQRNIEGWVDKKNKK
jgi:bifunctional UDP-N-acetylglucosamine pyrophosphorylase/glucosamine-1-phosphate N-acetyltransferase